MRAPHRHPHLHPAAISPAISSGARRGFLVRIGALPLLAMPFFGPGLLAGCGKSEIWPEGMVAIHWDRDTCIRCKMVISDRRFAAEVRGGSANDAFKFDDPGCLAAWLDEQSAAQPWVIAPETRIWVARFDSPDSGMPTWLDARAAHYVERTSPMGYNFAAVSAQENALDFNEMQQRVMAQKSRGHHEYTPGAPGATPATPATPATASNSTPETHSGHHGGGHQ